MISGICLLRVLGALSLTLNDIPVQAWHSPDLQDYQRVPVYLQ